MTPPDAVVSRCFIDESLNDAKTGFWAYHRLLGSYSFSNISARLAPAACDSGRVRDPVDSVVPVFRTPDSGPFVPQCGKKEAVNTPL